MKIRIVAFFSLLTVFMLIFSGCSNIGTGNLIIVGEVERGYTDYNRPYYSGTVKNEGNNTVYNAAIEFTIYETSAKVHIIDTAWDSLASLSDIAPGETTGFEAVAFDLDSTDQLDHYEVEITWLER